MISDDGPAVAFETSAALAGADDPNGATDVYVRDLVDDTTVLASAEHNDR